MDFFSKIKFLRLVPTLNCVKSQYAHFIRNIISSIFAETISRSRMHYPVLVFSSVDLHDKDSAAMLEENKLQIKKPLMKFFCLSSSNMAAMTASGNQEFVGE